MYSRKSDNMRELNDKLYFSVCYDIERPWNKKWSEIKQKPYSELTPEEKQEIQRRKDWDKLITRFIDELSKIGFRINYSVFLIPECNYDRAKDIVNRYTKRFNDIGAKNDIYILKYHPDSNDILRDKVLLHMKLKIEKLVKDYKKAIENHDTTEKRYIIRELEFIFKLSKLFEIYNEVFSYYEKLSKENNVSIIFRGSQQTLDKLAKIIE